MATKKKKTTPKKKVVKTKPEILSYSIKMVIPTVAFGNVQPEIVVKAGSVEEAHDFIAPHMNKLWKEYYLVDGKRPKSLPDPATIAPQPRMVRPVGSISPVGSITASPISSAALVKATQAINSCMSKDALDIIIERVKDSVKLTEEDKESLLPILETKGNELNEKK